MLYLLIMFVERAFRINIRCKSYSLPKMLLLPIRRLAFSFCRISGESEALLINFKGVRGLPLVSRFLGEGSTTRFGVSALALLLDSTRDRVGVATLAGDAALCSLRVKLDKLFSNVDPPKWSLRNLI